MQFCEIKVKVGFRVKFTPVSVLIPIASVIQYV